MKTITLSYKIGCIGLFIFICNTSLAQKRQLSLSGGALFGLSNTMEYREDYEFESSQLINDTTLLHAVFSGTSILTLSREKYLGYYVKSKIFFDLNDRWSLATGLDFYYTQFAVNESDQIENIQIQYVDTLIIMNDNSVPCEELTSHEEVVAAFFKRPRHTIQNSTIQVPIQINYKLIPDKLIVKAGIGMQANFTLRKTETVFSSERIEIDNHFFCDYGVLERVTTRNVFLEDIAFIGDLGLSYHITPNFTIDIGAELPLYRNLNTFVVNNLSIVINDYLPIRFTLGASYVFNVNW